MKKLLIATAALAMVAGTAQAQSNVSIYGNLDVSYGDNKVTGHATATSNTKTTGLADDAVNSSRIGFRGNEDLGGGMSAGFVIEANLDILRGSVFDKANQTGPAASTNAEGTAFLGATRQTVVSLGDNKLGSLGIGYKKTLETDFNDTYFTGTENSAGNTAHTNMRLTRANGVYYTSPVLSGVTVSLQHTTGQTDWENGTKQASDKLDASMTQARLDYKAGKLQVGGVYVKGSVDIGSAVVIPTTITGATTAQLAVGDNDYKGWGIGANYDFGVAKLTAQVAERQYGLTSAALAKTEYSSVGVTVPVGKLDLMAVVSTQEITATSGAKESDQDGYQLIARYNLSKRTNAYALVGQDKYDAVSTAVDRKTSVARVGVAHSF